MNTRTIRVLSCGAKYGAPPEDADFLVDCRGFENPHYDPKLRPKTGAAKAVRQFMEAAENTGEMRQALAAMLKAWLPGILTRSSYHRKKDVLLVFKCTGGKHRSRYFAIEVAQAARNIISLHPEWGKVEVVVNHRDKASRES